MAETTTFTRGPLPAAVCPTCGTAAPMMSGTLTMGDAHAAYQSHTRFSCDCGACEVPHARLAELHEQYPDNKVLESMIRNRVWAHTYEAAPDAWAALSYLDDMRFMVTVLLTLPDEIPAD